MTPTAFTDQDSRFRTSPSARRRFALPALFALSAACSDQEGELELRHHLVRTDPALVDPSICPSGSNVIVGTTGDDLIDGTPGRDCILGDEGNDRIRGGNGDDILFGGPGDDVLLGGNGNDSLSGEDGEDQLFGENGADQLAGGAGNDVLNAGNAADVVEGGAGNDVLLGDVGADTLRGGPGDDFVESGNGPDAVDGGPGNDVCNGAGCERATEAVQLCSSSSECAAGRQCAGGVCVACLADAACNDGNVCTFESCQPILGCRNPAVPDATACPDDTVCNGAEVCRAGQCTAGTPLVCDDGQYCNGSEMCDPSLGCLPGPSPVLDDGVGCTVDSCDELSDRAVHTVDDQKCDDGLFCTGTETCDAQRGCRPGTPPPVSDGIACTVDACVEAVDQVQHVPDNALCGPGFACGFGCENINECARGLDDCDPHATCTDTYGSFVCRCRAGFEGDGRHCAPICDNVTLATGVERCVRARDDGTIDLRFAFTDPSPWQQTYDQSDEPEVNYCGPTAGKNFLTWYGVDAAYGDLAAEMRTNTWDGPAVFGAVVAASPIITALVFPCLDPICWGVVTGIVSESFVKAGTLPQDLRASLDARAPLGYRACISQGDGNLDRVLQPLARGEPVVFLESGGSNNLHWAVATGVFRSGGELVVRVANSTDRDFAAFESAWSLAPVGDLALRGLLGAIGNLLPYTMVRWVPEGELGPNHTCP